MVKENNKICECCGCGFYVQQYRFKEAKYCSKKCFNEKWANKYVFNCQNCGKEHVAFGFTKGRKKYCSKHCMEEFRHTSLEELVKRGLQKKDNGCWEWMKSISSETGYGKLVYGGKHISAHRASYTVFKGDIPKGKHICHTCDNKRCVNPDHLWAGTQKENIQDCVSKGRMHDQTGKRLSNETIKKISDSKKVNPTRYWLGKKRSDETRKKISETKRKRNDVSR